MHSVGTMVVIGFKMLRFPKRNSTLEEETGYISTLKHYIGATEHVCNIKCKITVDKFRSCTSHKQWLSFFCVANIMKHGNILFETQGYTTVMFPHDFGTI